MNQNILWAFGIFTVYMFNKNLFYLAGGIFVGVNYHEHLKPYTDVAQIETMKRLDDIQKEYGVKIPGYEFIKPVDPETKTISLKEWFMTRKTGDKK